jgi:hypothetical protein
VRQLDAGKDEEREILPLLADEGQEASNHVFQVRGVGMIGDSDRAVPNDRRPARVLARKESSVGEERMGMKVDPKR